jgi:DNA-binding transcriptional MerR regulator
MNPHVQQEEQSSSQSDTFPSEGVTIGELARLTGFSAKAIRYYEQIGVLPLSRRAENGYRLYSQTDLNRLNLLRRLRLLGISLAEAKKLLVATLDAPCYEVQHELLDLVNARLITLDQEIAELHHLREEVVRYQQQLASGAVEKDEPFAVCYDQTCLACSPTATTLPYHPLTLLSREQAGAQRNGVDDGS